MRILFVDDERLVRDSMRDIIDWKRVGCTHLAFAPSAARAIELMEEGRFDLVISDIFMQKMDGVELSKYIRAHHPDTKVIILSAYEDFNMARGAIEAGVLKYLLKPVVPEELEAAILLANEEIAQRDRLRSSFIETEKMVNLYRPVVTDSLWRSLLEGKLTDAQALRRMLDISGLRAFEGRLTCLLLLSDAGAFGEALQERLEAAALELLPMMLGCVRMSDAECVLILTDGLDRALLQGLRARLAALLDAPVATICGQYVEDIGRLHVSYQDARKKRALYAAMRTDALSLPEADAAGARERDMLLRDITVGLAHGSRTVAGKIAQYYALLDRMAAPQQEGWLYEGRLLYEVYGALSERDVPLPPYAELLAEYGEPPERDARMRWLSAWLRQAAGQMRTEASDNKKALVQGVRRYIDENFRNEALTVGSIADIFHVSHTHLSRVFRQETGVTCIDYITHSRVDYAKSLLENTDLRHGEIALQAGYSSVYYFSIQFKKQTGETPGEYRKRVREEHE